MTAPSTTNTTETKSSSGFGFWSLSATASLVQPSRQRSPTTFYKRKLLKKPIIKEKKVTFVTQCQVRTFEVVALDPEFESNCNDDEEYWEQVGEDYWYQSHDFAAFKKDRRTLVDRIRTIGIARAKGNYSMEGLEFFLTLKAREVHKERVLDGWVSVLEIQADYDKESDDDDNDDNDCCSSQETKAQLIATKYAHVSKDCQEDAHQRAVETAQEIQEEDDKIVASVPRSPQPSKGSIQKEKVKALGVWGNFTSSKSNNNSNQNNTVTNFSTFNKIRPFPRQ
jgi:hypothetical protein